MVSECTYVRVSGREEDSADANYFDFRVKILLSSKAYQMTAVVRSMAESGLGQLVRTSGATIDVSFRVVKEKSGLMKQTLYYS